MDFWAESDKNFGFALSFTREVVANFVVFCSNSKSVIGKFGHVEPPTISEQVTNTQIFVPAFVSSWKFVDGLKKCEPFGF